MDRYRKRPVQYECAFTRIVQIGDGSVHESQRLTDIYQEFEAGDGGACCFLPESRSCDVPLARQDEAVTFWKTVPY
jgi:hypothetical protein